MINKYETALKEYKKGKSIKNICKELKMNSRMLSNYLKLNKIEIRGYSSTTKSYTDQEINKIINLYNNGTSIREIEKITKTERHDISYILKSNDVNVLQKAEYNESYFNKINTQDKAYWLGFMYADGNITNKSKVSLTLKVDDVSHLYTFRKCLDYNNKIFYRNVKCKKGVRWYATLLMSSSIMFNDLKNKGCVERKSLKLEFPSENILPKRLQRHFIRGYFDGDGCISIDRSKTPSIQFEIVGTFNFLSGVKNVLIENGFNIRSNVRMCTLTELSKNIVYDFRTKGNITALAIFDWLYKDANIFLERKHDRYINHKKNLENCRLKPRTTKDLRRLERN